MHINSWELSQVVSLHGPSSYLIMPIHFRRPRSESSDLVEGRYISAGQENTCETCTYSSTYVTSNLPGSNKTCPNHLLNNRNSLFSMPRRAILTMSKRHRLQTNIPTVTVIMTSRVRTIIRRHRRHRQLPLLNNSLLIPPPLMLQLQLPSPLKILRVPLRSQMHNPMNPPRGPTDRSRRSGSIRLTKSPTSLTGYPVAGLAEEDP
jgi:hypothetical protein